MAPSEKPIIFSGVTILMNGKLESRAALAASAVLPQPTSPREEGREEGREGGREGVGGGRGEREAEEGREGGRVGGRGVEE